MAITDKTAVQNLLLIDINESFDGQIDEWIEVVDEYIEKLTGVSFEVYDGSAAASDRTFDGTESKVLYIDPCTEVTEVRFAEAADPIDTDHYVVEPVRKLTKQSVKLKYMIFPEGIHNIYIKAKWGWKEVPPSIKFAATSLLAGIINEAWQSEGEIASVSVGRFTVTYKQLEEQMQKQPEVMDIINQFKRYAF